MTSEHVIQLWNDKIFERDNDRLLLVIQNVGEHIPIRLNAHYGTLVCIDCGVMFANNNDNEYRNCWDHLSSTHKECANGLKRGSVLDALKQSKSLLAENQSSNCTANYDSFIQMLGTNEEVAPIAGIKMVSGYVCSLCNGPGPRYCSLSSNCLWIHGHASHKQPNESKRVKQAPSFATRALIQKPFASKNGKYYPVDASQLTVWPPPRHVISQAQAFALIDNVSLTQPRETRHSSDQPIANRFLDVESIVSVEVARKHRSLASTTQKHPAIATLAKDVSEAIVSLYRRILRETVYESPLSLKQLVMEQPPSRKEQYQHNFNKLECADTEKKYAVMLADLVVFACVCSIDTLRRQIEAFPEALHLSDLETLRIKPAAIAFFQDYQSNQSSYPGSDSNNLLVLLAKSVLLRGVSPFHVGVNGCSDIMVRFLLLRQASADGGIKLDSTFTSKCAAVEYSARLLALHMAKENSRRPILPVNQLEYDQVVDRLQEARDATAATLCRYLGDASAFAVLSHFKACVYRYIRSTATPTVHVSYLSETSFHVGTKLFSREMVQKFVFDCHQELDEKMALAMDGFNPRPISLSRLCEDQSRSGLGESFIRLNRLEREYQKLVSHYHDKGADIILDRNAGTKFMGLCNEIQATICCLSYVVLGGTGRTPTLNSVLVQNTHDRRRSLYIVEGRLVVHVIHNKSNQVKECDTSTYWMYPKSIDELVVLFLVYLKPIQSFLAAEYFCGGDDEAKRQTAVLIQDHLFTTGSRRSEDDEMRRIFRDRFESITDTSFTANEWRHSLQFIAKTYLVPPVDRAGTEFDYAVNQQLGHSVPTGNSRYGVTADQEPERQRAAQMKASELWHKWLGIAELGKPIRSTR